MVSSLPSRPSVPAGNKSAGAYTSIIGMAMPKERVGFSSLAAGHVGSSLMGRNRLSAREPDVFSSAFEPVRTNSENSTQVRTEFGPRAEFGLTSRGWTGWDLNPGLPACKAGDLPLIYRPARASSAWPRG